MILIAILVTSLGGDYFSFSFMFYAYFVLNLRGASWTPTNRASQLAIHIVKIFALAKHKVPL
jgi:heme/copper-type cytochrome/quinol oxidase subunit 3